MSEAADNPNSPVQTGLKLHSLVQKLQREWDKNPWATGAVRPVSMRQSDLDLIRLAASFLAMSGD